ncbi:MAG: phosphoserine phosphatase SerB [Myxococcales bacterium]|nr:phosphoserine phosphatase SerB [Myxococcales bacterium]
MTGYQLIAVADRPIDLATARALEAAAGSVAQLDPFTIDQQHGLVLTCRASAADRAGAVALRHAVATAVAAPGLDLAVRVLPVVAPALVVMDMDSTILAIEVIDELARRHGVGDQVAAVTERAMRGELDFEASLRSRVRALAGLSAHALDELAAHLPLSPGLVAMMAALRADGAVFAIASGGFTFAADALAAQLGFAHAFANTLEIRAGELTGEVLGPVVTAARKALVVAELTARYQLTPAQTVAIGDGANDRPMLAQAGFGVAYRAKPALTAVADGAIVHGDLARVRAFVRA